jgi:hypothetical protein
MDVSIARALHRKSSDCTTSSTRFRRRNVLQGRYFDGVAMVKTSSWNMPGVLLAAKAAGSSAGF